ncbi:hypothetical protein BKA70DRAFT_1554542 [Coprinopsis sp. MPI-PUGE-AT-0042]|nr:hypothetical protein BKA70DRAFT_1554542 [Coprinopsis sp. MPI-PUGE-AT-0042]
MFKRKHCEYNNFYYPGSFIINPTPLPAVQTPERPREVKFCPPKTQKKTKSALKFKPAASPRPNYYNPAAWGAQMRSPYYAPQQPWLPAQPPPLIFTPGWAPQTLTTPVVVPGYQLPPQPTPHLCTPSAQVAELANQSNQIFAAQESTKAQIGNLAKSVAQLRDQVTHAQMASFTPMNCVIAPPSPSGATWAVHWDLLHCDWDVRTEATEAESFTGPNRSRKVLVNDLATCLPEVERIVLNWTLPDDFPWPLRHIASSPAYWRIPEVIANTGCKLTIHHVLTVLRNYLYEPLTTGELSAMSSWMAEWQALSDNQAKRIQMGQWYSEGDFQRFRRIDLLGSGTRLKGFTVEELSGDSLVLRFELHDVDDDD